MMGEPRGDGRSILIMLCGLPGSGKSTVAEQLAERLEDVEVVDADAVGVRKGHYENLKALVDGLADTQRYVVLDGAFFRREVRDAVRLMGYPVLLVYLKCPLRVCLQRNELRGEGTDSGAVIVMHGRFEEPEADESPVVVPTERVTPEVGTRLVLQSIYQAREGGGGMPENDPHGETL
jgi:tRNA uridine 5-carbamoylmethylation protein Kti12